MLYVEGGIHTCVGGEATFHTDTLAEYGYICACAFLYLYVYCALHVYTVCL